MKQQTSIVHRSILLGIFLTAFGGSFFLQSSQFFADPDSFYHIKVAQLIAHQGVLESFPWLAFTSLAQHYTDQHFLYHVLLIPFVTALQPFFGAKVLTALMNAALFALVAAFLQQFRVKLWYVFIVVLALTTPFLFRINLVKAPGLSLILLVTGLWLLFARRVLGLAALGFLYVWTYGGFIILGIMAVLFSGIATLHDWNAKRTLWSVFRRNVPLRWHRSALWAGVYGKLAIATGIGLFAGLLINPYFPQNLFFYWQQLVQIGIINFQNVVNVGGEWRPYGILDLLSNTVFVSIIVLVALVLFVIHRRRQTAESWTLLVLAAFFFLITLKSRRYVELYVPFAVLFAAFTFRDALPHLDGRGLAVMLQRAFLRHRIVVLFVGLYIILASLTVVTRDYRQLNIDLKSGFRTSYLSGVGHWLTEHTQARSIIMQSDWDEFPNLFYYADKNYYIVGLDPTFMYQYNKVLYQRWAAVSSGQRREDAAAIITQDLKSSTVVVTKDHKQFQDVMEGLQGFVKVYDDPDASIYQRKDLAAHTEITTDRGHEIK